MFVKVVLFLSYHMFVKAEIGFNHYNGCKVCKHIALKFYI